MEHPEGLPHILIDRCLGNTAAALLRQQGLHITTLAEHTSQPSVPIEDMEGADASDMVKLRKSEKGEKSGGQSF